LVLQTPQCLLQRGQHVGAPLRVSFGIVHALWNHSEFMLVFAGAYSQAAAAGFPSPRARSEVRSEVRTQLEAFRARHIARQWTALPPRPTPCIISTRCCCGARFGLRVCGCGQFEVGGHSLGGIRVWPALAAGPSGPALTPSSAGAPPLPLCSRSRPFVLLLRSVIILCR
jgi:hypothetical protein